MWIMELIFIIASITDKLDGYLARKNNQVTNFGKFLDPIADKILVVAAMILFVEMGRLPAWIPIIVIFREFAVSGYRLIAVQNSGKVIAANVWGKLKTVTQMIAIILMFLTTQPYFAFVMRAKTEQDALVNSALTYMTTGDFIMNILASVFMTISVIATIFSGYEYLKGGKLSYKELENLPVMCLEGSTSTRKYVEDYLAERGTFVRPEFELATSDMLIQFAVRNLGVASVVSDFAEKYIENGELFVLKFDRAIPEREFCIVSNERAPMSAAAEKLYDFLLVP